MHDLTRLNRRQSNGKGGVRAKSGPVRGTAVWDDAMIRATPWPHRCGGPA